jgi:hypothetical protein
MCYRRNLRIPGDKFLHVNGSPSKDALPRNQFRYAAIWRDRLEPLNPVILRWVCCSGKPHSPPRGEGNAPIPISSSIRSQLLRGWNSAAKNSKPATHHHSFGINRTETGGLSPVVMFTGMPKAS